MFSTSITKVVAQEADVDQTLTNLISGAIDPSELYPALDANSVPEIVGYDEAVANNHILRLYEEEGNDLNKIVFLNIDGSKTMYIYDFPVKYVASDGNIQDITLEIASNDMEQASFQTAANSTTTTFSAQLSDGISLSGNSMDITLIPLLNKSEAGIKMATSNAATTESSFYNATRINKKTIAYNYDEKTTIEYSLTYTGFKEDIVVSEYTGQTEYHFTLHTNGYRLTAIQKIAIYCDDHSTILGMKWPLVSEHSIYDYQQEAFTNSFYAYLYYQRSMEQS